MNTPTVYTPEQLRSEHMASIQAGLPDGRWVAARPLGWQGLCLRRRLHTAWMVFTGQWDALRWEGQTPADPAQQRSAQTGGAA